MSQSPEYEIIIPLNESQSMEPGILFPPGCHVCYDHQTSADNRHIESSEGVVTAVSLGRDPSKPLANGLIYIYDVEVDVNGVRSTTRFVQEHLAYASNCPVYLSTEEGEVEAEVAFSQKVIIEKVEEKLVYIVIFKKGGRVCVEKGARASRVRYRHLLGAQHASRDEGEVSQAAAISHNFISDTDAKPVVNQSQNAATARSHKQPPIKHEPIIDLSMEDGTASVQLSPISEKSCGIEANACNEKHNQHEECHTETESSRNQPVVKKSSSYVYDDETVMSRNQHDPDSNCAIGREAGTSLKQPNMQYHESEAQTSHRNAVAAATASDASHSNHQKSCAPIGHDGARSAPALHANRDFVRQSSNNSSSAHISKSNLHQPPTSNKHVHEEPKSHNPQRTDRSPPKVAQKRGPSSQHPYANTSREDRSSSRDRPRKVQKRTTRPGSVTLVVPYWVSSGEDRDLLEQLKGKGGCKLKSIKAATTCDVYLEQMANKLEIIIEPTDQYSHTQKALNSVLESIIKFVDDKYATWRLLWEMLPNHSPDGPVICSCYEALRQLDRNPSNKALWVELVDLPRGNTNYHGAFLLERDTLRKIKNEGCQLYVVCDASGRSIHYPGCRPYALVFGTRKLPVIKAAEIVKQAIRWHQGDCYCTPKW